MKTVQHFYSVTLDIAAVKRTTKNSATSKSAI